MKRIAVICAYSAGRNPGMISSDLAFMSVHKIIEQEFAVTFFCAELKYAISHPQYSINYELLSDQKQLHNFDLIIYWGDFIHWIGYAKQDWLPRFKIIHPSYSENSILDIWYKLFLLEGAPDLQKKVIVFGGTLYALNAKQLSDERYTSALTSLYKTSKLALVRDELSANFISQLVSEHNDYFGCDCALLMNNAAVGTDPTPKEKYALCSFGRSDSSAAMPGFAIKIAARMGLKLIYMDWLGQPFGMGALQDRLKLVRGAELVITDIYHLSISAWRDGVPALCIGKGSGNPTDTLSDKKKEIFYRQMFGADWYLYLEDLFESMKSESAMETYCKTCIETINNISHRDFIFSALKKQREKSFTRLLSAIIEKKLA